VPKCTASHRASHATQDCESTQFNVVVPNSLTNREQPIVARYRGLTTQGGTLLSVQQ
jgi:hypothetical protein